ncbi:DUF3288 family protein [Synechococcales cyanobacterium C]|uniref:DUF3288 family protein n=1 Tax=Petrachloros mirabilis ULC683 TaxID=2781853 RepID=A0A8K2AN97_9CYAN|nr:DUF3288 family protein [Petrachloros mirabilis]NCJ05076.1 DUF3288 family protein [Petrachloros mirabilis ULC683]
MVAPATSSFSKDQQHPQWASDRQITNRLLQEDCNDYNLAELARLMIRYAGFPGGRDIQADLEKTLTRWQLSEAQLFEKTRQIHAQGEIYHVRSGKRDDWT